ncbi:MAG: hypothetical protein A2X11_13040 [Bacteroidetes bacterium GWE2_42_24]|nr:MAG: hypothetical protein A2X11_13040 [Bacteroidetes bacterium GWE2_42_24]OFY25333.1 MAG: hypothetical protein A2X09_10240 [Bacteroidetes bacterium GWF2_43_11]
MYVELTFPSAPVIELQKADLLYDKKLAISMRFDDGYRSPFTNSVALFLGGENHRDEELNVHEGFYYTDGCGNNIPYVADFAAIIAVIEGSGAGTEYLSWDDCRQARDYGYGVLPHEANISIDLTDESPYADWLADMAESMLYYFNELGFKPIVATASTGDLRWSSILDSGVYKSPYFDNGLLFMEADANPHICAGVGYANDRMYGLDLKSITRESFGHGQPYPMFYHSKRILRVDSLPAVGELYCVYILPDDTMHRWNGTSYDITTESLAGGASLEQIKTAAINCINASGARAFTLFTHRLTYDPAENDNGGNYLPYYKSEILQWLDTNYGKNGSDQLLFASANTVAEYVYCREFSTINTYYEGNRIILEIIPPDNPNMLLRRPALTLKLNSNVAPDSVNIFNIDRFSENVVGNTQGIINVEWSSEYYNTALRYVVALEATPTQIRKDDAFYFTSFVSDPAKKNALMQRINAVEIPQDRTYLIDFGYGGTDVTPPPFNNITNVTTATQNVNILDIDGVDNGILCSIYAAFASIYGTGISGSYYFPVTAVMDCFLSQKSVAGIVKFSGLDNSKIYRFRVNNNRQYQDYITTFRLYNSLDSGAIGYAIETATRASSPDGYVDITPIQPIEGVLYLSVLSEDASANAYGALSALEILEYSE